MDDRVALPPWELAASPSGFFRTWVRVTFRPKAFVADLGDRASLGRPTLFAALMVALGVALVAAATAASTYPSLQRFGATEHFGVLFRHQMGWYAGQIFCFLGAATLSTWFVASLARRPLAATFRVRLYTLGPLTWLIGWWVMFRWLERGSDERAWRPRALALAGWISEWAFAFVLSTLLAGEIRDAIVALFCQ
jgi:hypothetical protein